MVGKPHQLAPDPPAFLRLGRALLCLLLLGLSATEAEDRETLESFLSEHCYACHDDLESKGGLNLLDLPFALSEANEFTLWERVFDRVRDGEMPPSNEPRPDPKAKEQFLANLEAPLLAADLADKRAKGRVRVRRLTRVEYEHTVHDLLHIDIPLANLLPEDQATHGFEVVAKGQQFSHFNLARYLELADRSLDEAFERALEEPETFSRSFGPRKLGREGAGRGNYRGPQLADDRAVFWPITLQFYGRLPATRVPASGWYRVRIRDLRAINAKHGSAWGTLRSGACASSAPILHHIGLVEATAKKRDLVFEAWIEKGHMLELKPNDATTKRAKTGARGGNVGYKDRDLKRDGHEGFEISGIEMERIYPNGSREDVRETLFGSRKWADGKAFRKRDGVSEADLVEAIRRFASEAFRRPVDAKEIAAYRELALAEQAKPGRTPADALEAAYRAVLCSPRFLTLVEKPGRLDDYEIATRLSYALWNSLPDRELLDHAEAGRLSEFAVIRKQLARMLEDPRSERFVNSFTDQWLDLRQINFTTPDRRLYRTFDSVVQDSMVAETRAFFEDLVDHDRPVHHLVRSDHTFLNERLARFYGLEGAHDALERGSGLQRVALEDPRRGGLVTQGSILKVTADGTTTSPVIRGVFVAERILGIRIPPPPPGVPAVEPDIRGAVSIRDQLEKHRSSEDCAACHRNIDPGGFALETYDPVGLWRTRYGKSNKAASVDPSGKTPEGEPFEDIRDWKAIYRGKPDKLAANLARQLLTYATGAEVRFSDRRAVERIVARAAEKNHGVRTLIEHVFLSEVFLTK